MKDNYSDLYELHKLEIYILEQFKSICEKLNLTYYAANGTLIGAIRHQGFIPWDDDIDVSMPRKDYDIFIEQAQKYLPEDLKVLTFEDSKDDTIYTARICKIDTLVRVNTANISHEDNIWIDIWALDGMPGNNIANWIHKSALLWKRMLVQISRYDELIHQHRAGRPMHERIIMSIADKTHLGRGIDTKDAKRKVEKCMCKYSIETAPLAINFWSPYKFKEEVLAEWYGTGKDVPFEDTNIHIPDNADRILRNIYGDYMELPPERERGKEHCMEIIYLNREETR